MKAERQEEGVKGAETVEKDQGEQQEEDKEGEMTVQKDDVQVRSEAQKTSDGKDEDKDVTAASPQQGTRYPPDGPPGEPQAVSATFPPLPPSLESNQATSLPTVAAPGTPTEPAKPLTTPSELKDVDMTETVPYEGAADVRYSYPQFFIYLFYLFMDFSAWKRTRRARESARKPRFGSHPYTPVCLPRPFHSSIYSFINSH